MPSTKPSYYGPFFWLAVVSFFVPCVVAFRAFQEAPVTTKPTPHPDASGVDHALWDYLLKAYVENGLVDYHGMKRDYLFRTYLRELAEAEPKHLTTSADQLALFCNAYNAFVINGVITHKISNSVMDFQADGKEFFDIEEHILGERTVSLNYIEHEIIRKHFKDPRVHVALVCAARSCPAIRPEAYVGKRLNKQLDDQSRLFANNTRYVAFVESENVLKLSPLLDWYGGDWETQGGYLPWLAARVDDASLKQVIEGAGRDEMQVEFLKYDWSLNSQAPNGAGTGGAPKKSAEFGSGSIPNE